MLKNCDRSEFVSKVNGKKIICFGAGALLRESAAKQIYFIEHLEDHIAFFVDNDPKKINAQYQYEGKLFDIYSPDVFYDIDLSQYVILITTIAHYDIYTQLENMDILNDIDCYIYRAIVYSPDIDIQQIMKDKNNHFSCKHYKENLLSLKNIHKDKRCFIIGNGPSLKTEDLEKLKNEITFAANCIYFAFEKTSWRPTYYICVDQLAYARDHKIITSISCQKKFTAINNIVFSGQIYNDTIYYSRSSKMETLIDNQIKVNDRFPFSYDITKSIYAGNTVLYDAVQLAVYMGFSEIYLLGVDCNYQIEMNPDETIKENNVKNYFCDAIDKDFKKELSVGIAVYKMQIAWQSAKEACEKVGVTIKNATRGGKLEIFERVDFDELMKNQ